MSLLLPDEGWAVRRRALEGSLGALADGIAADLEPVLARPLHVPDAKATLSREGGRCPRDGSLLVFDPFDELHHRCTTCGGRYTGDEHRGFWRYWYHLWLAERAVHAAVLYRLRGEARHGDFAAAVLDGYAARYLRYPNRDNVLGPTRVFFSTYLEAIWLLQLCIVVDALHTPAPSRYRASVEGVRERVVEPSLQLVASYDEGRSNRQVWNTAASLAAGRVLGIARPVEAAVHGRSGLVALLREGMLPDGTWYEGENYHLFAHRGLWYAVVLADAAGVALPPELVQRFDAGFLAPFLTAFPDLTLPSRRDSQYAISLRQPRVAESCELGLARRDDPLLHGVLAALYDAPPEVAERSNGRAATSADVERNLPAMRLGRSDLGWRALLFARAELPPTVPQLPGSVLLEGQGIGVLRRDGGRIHVALDYGESGGGHGHPDRLGLLLSDGPTRWLDDMGTGSYVDRTLHWYRSTLAHNAPLVDGHSQQRTDGTLLAWEERADAGWIRASAAIAPGVRAERTIVVMADYLVDELRWSATYDATVDLPIHAPVTRTDAISWQAGALTGGGGLEDGFEFIGAAERCVASAGGGTASLRADPGPLRPGMRALRAVVAAPDGAEWWRLEAPGPPGTGRRHFHLVRACGRAGAIRAVWAWGDRAAQAATFGADALRVEHRDGTADTHRPTATGWRIDRSVHGEVRSAGLGGLRVPAIAGGPAAPDGASRRGRQAPAIVVSPDHPFAFRLGEGDYRRSEESWHEAGQPRARGRVSWDGRVLTVDVEVPKRTPLVMHPPGTPNPLDNEVPESNADGIQFYLECGGGACAGGWTVVPQAGRSDARVVPVPGWSGLTLDQAEWAVTPGGYGVSLRVTPPPSTDGVLGIGLVVNDIGPERQRRRGQLVLGGAAGEWAYLRGDRFERSRLLPIRLRSSEL